MTDTVLCAPEQALLAASVQVVHLARSAAAADWSSALTDVDSEAAQHDTLSLTLCRMLFRDLVYQTKRIGEGGFALTMQVDGAEGVVDPVVLAHCDIHNQLGMSLFTFVAEFASVMPWAMTVIQRRSDGIISDDLTDLLVVMESIRNSANDFRDQLDLAFRKHKTQSLPTPSVQDTGEVLFREIVYSNVEHPYAPSVIRRGVPFCVFVAGVFVHFDDLLTRYVNNTTKQRALPELFVASASVQIP